MGSNFDKGFVVEIDVGQSARIPTLHERFRELESLVTRVSNAAGGARHHRFREFASDLFICERRPARS